MLLFIHGLVNSAHSVCKHLPTDYKVIIHVSDDNRRILSYSLIMSDLNFKQFIIQ